MKLKRYEWAALAAALVLVLTAAVWHGVHRRAPVEFMLRAAEPVHSAAEDEIAAAATVDINSADRETLCTLGGIGEVLAERIIAYREENGPFAAIEDIMNVNGIGSGTFGKIRSRITVG